MNFKISARGIDLIKSFEGCQLNAYLCPANVWTIGWGTTEAINGVKPHSGMKITQKQADDLLIKNLKSYEAAVNKYVKVPINQNHYDALVSFAYNCGCGALQKSTLLQYLNQGRYEDAANQFDLWNKGGGKVLAGLVRRRAAEKKLFLTPIEIKVEEDKELINAVNLLHKRGIINSPKVWFSVSVMKLEYVECLIKNMGGLDRLIKDKIISDKLLWEHRQYNVNHVRSLIIKYSKLA